MAQVLSKEATAAEKFIIGGRSYEVRENDGGRFQPWVGGCAISSSVSTKDSARAALHEYAVKEAKRIADRAAADYARASETLAALGDDVFNLGRYRTGL